MVRTAPMAPIVWKGLVFAGNAGGDNYNVSGRIYALDAGGYKVCFAPAGKPRPTKLGSAPGSGYILQVWSREKKN